jgi:hypothetical protein
MDADAYHLAYALVASIDADLQTGRRHYRDWTGRLLTTLEEVLRAILERELQPG